MPTETINWSDLGTRYGLSTSNRGQIVKEYLAMHHIPNAMTSERPSRQPRRAKGKFPGGKISQPMFKPSMTHKNEIERKIINGEKNIGIPITPIQCTTYKIDNDSKTVIEETSTIHGHHIPMIDIRHALLNRHETLGIVRVYTDNEIDSMGDTCIKNVVENMKIEVADSTNLNTMKETIRSTTRQRT